MADLDALQPGDEINGLRIEKMLGRGGFGITYLARNIVLDNLVAIKEFFPQSNAHRSGSEVLPRSTSDVEVFEFLFDRFKNEAQVAAKLDHPNIVHIRDYFEANGTAFIVMNYINGVTFQKWIDKFPPEQKEAALKPIVPQVTDALKYIHDQNIFHRDIKPDNIFITKDNQAILLDFGTARLTETGYTETAQVQSKGFSPLEQTALGSSSKTRTQNSARGRTFMHLGRRCMPGSQVQHHQMHWSGLRRLPKMATFTSL